MIMGIQGAGTASLSLVIFPVTHSVPADPNTVVEIPLATKQRLGLDPMRSWIVCHEANRFLWPGPDLRPIGGKPGHFVYGLLPGTLIRLVQERIRAALHDRGIAVVPRDPAES